MVTLETEERFVLLQQVVRHRPVRVVTDRAVFLYRWVLVGERSLFVRMTLQAEIPRTLLRLQIVYTASVHIMAICTCHLSFPNRMMRRIINLCPDILMTLITELRFRLLQGSLGRILMNLMTINAGYTIEGMLISAPVHPSILGMASQADGRGLSRRNATRLPHIGETDDLRDIPIVINVKTPGTMAGLAAFVPLDLKICQPPVDGPFELLDQVLMAVGAGLRSLICCSLDCHRHLNHRFALPFRGSARPHDHRHRYHQRENQQDLYSASFHVFLLRFPMTNLLLTPVATSLNIPVKLFFTSFPSLINKNFSAEYEDAKTLS